MYFYYLKSLLFFSESGKRELLDSLTLGDLVVLSIGVFSDAIFSGARWNKKSKKSTRKCHLFFSFVIQKAETFQHFLDGIRNEIEAITLLSRLGEPIV